jgi:hypothetical protein
MRSFTEQCFRRKKDAKEMYESVKVEVLKT